MVKSDHPLEGRSPCGIYTIIQCARFTKTCRFPPFPSTVSSSPHNRPTPWDKSRRQVPKKDGLSSSTALASQWQLRVRWAGTCSIHGTGHLSDSPLSVTPALRGFSDITHNVRVPLGAAGGLRGPRGRRPRLGPLVPQQPSMGVPVCDKRTWRRRPQVPYPVLSRHHRPHTNRR